MQAVEMIRNEFTDSLPKDFLARLFQFMGPGDYVSHGAALFLNGHFARLQSPFTLVSRKRRRDRMVLGVRVHFVNHRPGRRIECRYQGNDEARVLVASPEMALVDLLSDMDYSPDLRELARLFTELPFVEAKLLKLAQSVSDSVLKRAAFFLLWCGRMPYSEAFFKSLSRASVWLDPREKKEENLWDSQLRIFFPLALLSVPISPGIPLPCVSARIWRLLRNSAGFRENMVSQRCLIPRESPKRTAFLASWACSHSFCTIEEIKDWLNRVGLSELPDGIDFLSLKRYRHHYRGILPTREILLELLESQVGLFPTDPDFAQRIFRLSLLLNDRKVLSTCVRILGENLLEWGRSNDLSLFAKSLTGGKRKIETLVGSIVTRALAIRGQARQGKEVFDLTEQPSDSEESGWYHLAKGLVFHSLGLDNRLAAERAFSRAKNEFLSSKNCLGVAKAEFNLGCLLLANNDLPSARRKFLSVWGSLKRKQKVTPNFRGITLGNLGIVETKLGNLSRASSLLRRGLQFCRSAGNQGATIPFFWFNAQVLLRLGNVEGSKECANAGYRSLSRVNGDRWAMEIFSLLAWLFRLTGQAESSAFWRRKMDQPGNWSKALRDFTDGRDHLFLGDLSAARSFLGQAAEKAMASGLSGSFKSLVGLHLALSWRGNPGQVSEAFQLTDAFLKNPADHFQADRIRLIRGLLQRVDFHSPSLEEILGEIVDRGQFDPLWFLYVDLLIDGQFPSSIPFIQRQNDLSTPEIRRRASEFWAKQHILREGILNLHSDENPPFLLFEKNRIEGIGFSDYRTIRKRILSQRHFLFDGIEGLLSYFPNSKRIRPSAYPSRLLAFLFRIYPEPASIPQVCQFLWGTSYNEEFDLATLKATISRAQRLLHAVCAIAAIKLSSRKDQGILSLGLPENWTAILPVTEHRA